MSDELSAKYLPNEVESRIYARWEAAGHFVAHDRSTKPPFAIVLPPPNVTGSLHMGHALNHVLQDTLIRWKRMLGFNALWLPGTDHAGIATQNVVEKVLRKEGKSRHELGRDAFVQRVWDWKDQYGNRIVEQMRRLGDSCDWNRLAFTLDDNLSKAVRKVFVELYHRKLIYRGQKLINWCTRCETALSDLEVDHKELKGTLWHIEYPFESGPGGLIVATTRPETLLGDVAVCVHPEDERYQTLHGKHLRLPLTSRLIPILADPQIDREFGSGVVKITPAHDFNDYDLGQRHQLELINILHENGKLNDQCGPSYAGLNVKEARLKVVEDLKKLGLLKGEVAHSHSVGHCSRCATIVEPLLSSQWFVKMKELSGPARRVVESGTITFEPESWTKTFLHWMSIIQDWCISRQLWWGHRIPAWYCESCEKVTVAEEPPTQCASCLSPKLKQDEDVLDTWFSSALWPFSTLGWPAETEAQKTFYPTSVLVTGHDIIFFWVARMIVMGLEFKKDVPFRKVFMNGLVRTLDGQKMSKSLANAADPIDLIESSGADALRFTLLAMVASGRDLKFSEQRLEGYRNFMNKIWNATRFALNALKDFRVPPEGLNALPAKSNLSIADQWIIFRTGEVEREVNAALESYRFSDAVNALYAFTWHEFCDWYLEFIKPLVYGEENADKQASQLVLAQTLNRVLRLLHPFIPFITEELFQKIPIRSEALIIAPYPTPANDSLWLSMGSKQAAFELEIVKEVITAIRNIRGENRINPATAIHAHLVPSDANTQKILGENKKAILRMAQLKSCEIGVSQSQQKCALTPVRIGETKIDVIIPLEGLVDFNEEIQRISKAIEKAQKDVLNLTKRLDNSEFVKNAPPEIVEADREELKRLRSHIQDLQGSLNRLSPG